MQGCPRPPGDPQPAMCHPLGPLALSMEDLSLHCTLAHAHTGRLVACCVAGPKRFTSVLGMMLERPNESDLQGALAVTAAMHAVAAAGGKRLTGEPHAMQVCSLPGKGSMLAAVASRVPTICISASSLRGMS